ncbi:dimethylarginine dimethylaminohydrolase family protein [Candidatus Neomarinimicrobiota bacterium]
MLCALTHIVSPRLNECELTYRSRQPIDIGVASEQHAAYCDTLRSFGLKVIELETNRDYPDSVFIEDSAIVMDEIAVLTRHGVASRRGEVEAIGEELSNYREIQRIQAPATLEGGDVLVVGKKVFVGISSRTNDLGVLALEKILTPFEYTIVRVNVRGALHLKSAVTTIDEATILANPKWFDTAPFANYRMITVADAEPWAANALPVGGTILMADGYPFTAEKVVKLGYKVKLLDIRELQKAEAGLTCSSIIFRE